jgi:ABC-type amino acid transport substrate-binding protein
MPTLGRPTAPPPWTMCANATYPRLPPPRPPLFDPSSLSLAGDGGSQDSWSASSRRRRRVGTGSDYVLPFSSRGHTNGVWHNANKVFGFFFLLLNEVGDICRCVYTFSFEIRSPVKK